MKNLLREFKHLLEESTELPMDELRNYYLVPAKNLLTANPEIGQMITDDQTALIMVIKKILRSNHPLRTTHLNILAWDVIDLCSKETLNYQDKDGNTAAHYTCSMECFSVGVLDLMKQSGVNFNLQNKKGETPLMLLADSDSLDDLKFIHAYTNEKMINANDFLTGATALHKAVKHKKINNVLFLLENGASVYVPDSTGHTVLDYIENKELYKKGNPVFYAEISKILKVFAEKENVEKIIESFNTQKPYESN